MGQDHIITYAQNREDIILRGFFSPDEVGFYVDVGAEHPTKLSVTKIFYDQGWHGINIEPIKQGYELFTKDRARDINVNLGISNRSGALQFRQYEGSGYSTFSEDMKIEHTKDAEHLVKNYKDYVVNVTTLKNLFKEYDVNSIQFMKVDVEGLEYEVLSGNDWSKYRPEVICVEANHIMKDWRKLLIDQGYKKVFFDGLNEYYVDTSVDNPRSFDYVESVIYKEPIVHFELLDDFKKRDEAVSWLKSINTNLEAELGHARVALNNAQAQITTLQGQLNEITPFKRHFKRTLKNRLILIDKKISALLGGSGQKVSKVNISDNYDIHNIKDMQQAAQKYDLANFTSYAKKNHLPITLLIYNKAKYVIIKCYRKIIGNNKRTNN